MYLNSIIVNSNKVSKYLVAIVLSIYLISTGHAEKNIENSDLMRNPEVR